MDNAPSEYRFTYVPFESPPNIAHALSQAGEKLKHPISLQRRVLLDNLVRKWAWYLQSSSSSDSSSEDSSSDDDDSSSDDMEDGDDSAVPAPAVSSGAGEPGCSYADFSANQDVSTNASPSVSEDGAGPPPKRPRLDD
ncbi:hypothetical protein MTO96_000739 [Rhipicephalus appendiculatus]